MNRDKKTIVIVTAGGIGKRMQNEVPKQFIFVNNRPLLLYTLDVFENHPSIDSIVVSCLDGWIDVLNDYICQAGYKKIFKVVAGGKTNQDSIYKGIKSIQHEFDGDSLVLVHDGNRCLVSSEIVSDNISTAIKYGNGVVAIKNTDVMFRSHDGFTSNEEVPREELMRTQTPSAFFLDKLIWAYELAKKKGIYNTSCTFALMTQLGETIHFSKGSVENFKITTPDELDLFKAFLKLHKSND